MTAICSDKLIGPFFFDQTVNGDRYLSMLLSYFTCTAVRTVFYTPVAVFFHALALHTRTILRPYMSLYTLQYIYLTYYKFSS